MEGSTSPKNDIDKTKQDSSQESLIGANWPSLPVPADSQRTIPDATQDTPIQPAQKSPTPWKGQQRGPADYERDRVEKYAKYFKGNEILPIPELEQKLTPRILSLVVSDLKTKRLVGLKKETFEELLRKAGIPCQYFCRKSLRRGMSSFLRKTRLRSWQPTTLRPGASGYSRNIGAPVGSTSPSATSRPPLLGRCLRPT